VLHCDSQRLVVNVFHMALQVELRLKDLRALVAGIDCLLFLFLYHHLRLLSEGDLDLLVLLLFRLHV